MRRLSREDEEFAYWTIAFAERKAEEDGGDDPEQLDDIQRGAKVLWTLLRDAISPQVG